MWSKLSLSKSRRTNPRVLENDHVFSTPQISTNTLPLGCPATSFSFGAWPFSQAPNSESCTTLGFFFLPQQNISTKPHQPRTTEHKDWNGQLVQQCLRKPWASGYNYTILELHHLLLPTIMHTAYRSTFLTHCSYPKLIS